MGLSARSEQAREASHLLAPKPTDGLLVCLAAARAGNLDLGIIERADPNWQLSVGRTYNVAYVRELSSSFWM
jgi:hypothetical protein